MDPIQPFRPLKLMATVLLLAAVLQSRSFSASASPITVPIPRRAQVLRSEEVQFDKDYRSTVEIFWSCIVTVFACTWLSVHPNVSGASTSWRQRMKHRIGLMLWGIIGPEFLVIFAYRQWRGCNDITRAVCKMKKDGKPEVSQQDQNAWTKAHSHFLQMGGFMWKGSGDSEASVCFIETQYLLKGAHEVGHEALRLLIKTAPTEDELWDKSKGDSLAKTIVALQTAYFLAQIGGRAVQKLAITELEVITLAYAAFNAAMYAFWWNKPLDVQCPILIPFSGLQELQLYQSEESRVATSLYFSLPRTAAASVDQQRPAEGVVSHGLGTHSHTSQPQALIQSESDPKTFKAKVVEALYVVYWPLHRLMDRVYILTGFKRSGKNYVFSAFDSPHKENVHQDPEDPSRVPTFHAYSETPDVAPSSIAISALAMLLASCFGAIHCLAWSFSRLGPYEALLWRICALIICLSPVVSCLMFLAATIYSWRLQVPEYWSLHRVFKTLLIKVLAPFHNKVFIPLLLPGYLIARLVLIALALAQLRNLPKSAHKTVEWSEFIPHV